MKKLFISLALFLALPAYAQAAIAFDAVSGAKDNSGAVTSLTWSHTTSGSDRILVVLISISQTTGTGRTITGVTYNGVAMTHAVTSVSPDVSGANITVAEYYLVAPATGANNVVVSISGVLTGNKQFAANAQSYTGVHQTSPIGATGTYSNYGAPTNVPVSVTVPYANSWLVGAASEDAGDIAAGAAGAGTTYRGVAQFNMFGADSNATVGTGAQTLNWGRAGATGEISGVALSLTAVGAIPSTSSFSPWQFSDF